MEIFDINIFDLLTNPVGTATSAALGACFFQFWKFISSILNPIKYVEKLYNVADNIVIKADDNIIDKIRNKAIKNDISKKLKAVLKQRKKKIDELIKRISD
tara:strand:- start:447 stop:749 length:303 start_codon:yes stop_codon:yes gene_type:complete